jgi:predicted  nucleic acid-binding Zn-ribbon protein
MTELDEKRLNELETIVWDFPSLINTRFERFDAETDANRVALADNTARLVQVERRLNALTTDMRDMRAGITRHMLEQSRQMTAVVAKVDALATRMDGLEDRIGKLEGRLEGLEGRLEGLEGRLEGLEGRLEGLEGRIDRLEGNIVGRMDMLETGQKAILDSLQQLLSRPR